MLFTDVRRPPDNFVSSNGETFRKIISKDPPNSFEKLNRQHKNTEDISKNAEENYGNDNKKTSSICFVEETEPPQDLKALFDKALELAGANDEHCE